MKHYYAITTNSEAHNVVLAFNSNHQRNLYIESYNGSKVTAKEAKKFNEVRHFYSKVENDWYSQLYPKNMWFK